MNKKRSPREIIEGEKDSKLEHGYIKFPGEEMIPATLRIYKDKVDWNYEKVKGMRYNNKGSYSGIHTHPYDPSKHTNRRITEASPLPSGSDLKGFLKDDNAKTIVIAQQNQDTGKVDGYFVLRKTKDTLPIGFSHTDNSEEFKQKYFSGGLINGIKRIASTFFNIIKINKTAKKYEQLKFLSAALDEPEYLSQAIDKIAQKYHLQYRLVPSEDYETDEDRTKFIKKKRGLEEKLEMSIMIFSFITSFFFLSSNLTGNVIADLSAKTTSFLGAGLLIIGLVADFFWLRNRKR